MSVKAKVKKTCNGIPYEIEVDLEDLKQLDAVGKVVGAIEEFIQKQFKPKMMEVAEE